MEFLKIVHFWSISQVWTYLLKIIEYEKCKHSHSIYDHTHREDNFVMLECVRSYKSTSNQHANKTSCLPTLFTHHSLLSPIPNTQTQHMSAALHAISRLSDYTFEQRSKLIFDACYIVQLGWDFSGERNPCLNAHHRGSAIAFASGVRVLIIEILATALIARSVSHIDSPKSLPFTIVSNSWTAWPLLRPTCLADTCKSAERHQQRRHHSTSSLHCGIKCCGPNNVSQRFSLPQCALTPPIVLCLCFIVWLVRKEYSPCATHSQ